MQNRLMSESFRHKTSEELHKQIREVEHVYEEGILPSSKKEDFFNMSEHDLKEQFPKRYEIYLKTLLLLKNQSHIDISGEDLGSFKKWLSLLNSLDSYIESEKNLDENKSLREHQVSVFESLRTFFEQGNREGYIKLPTGYGKTVIFVEFLEATNLKSLIVVPRKLLVEQTESSFSEFAENVDVGKIYSEAKEHGRHVTVITYNSLISQLNQGTIQPQDYDCLILDEAHRSLSPERMAAVSRFSDCIKLGFTATPDFSQQKRVGNLLETNIHSITIPEAVQEGAISPFSVILAQTTVDTSNVRVTSDGNFNEQDLARAVNVASRNEAAVQLYKQAFLGRTGVAYCVGVEHAKTLADLFNQAGISAATISGGMSQKAQIDILKLFKRGEIQVLCNADILIEGFDVPKTSVCLNLRPTLSRVIAEQRGGRTLRLDKNNPSKHAVIVEFLDQHGSELIPQVLFSDIAGGAIFFSPDTAQSLQNQPISPSVPHSPAMSHINIKGLVITVSKQEIMRITQQFSEVLEKEQPPETWRACDNIAQEFGIDYTMLKKHIDALLVEQPELRGKESEEKHAAEYTKTSGKTMFYSPYLVLLLKERVPEKPPETWRACDNIAQEFGIKDVTLKKHIDALLAEQPKLQGKESEGKHAAEYGGGVRSGKTMFYSPYFVSLLKERVPEKPPETWRTCHNIAQEFGIKDATLKKHIDALLAEQPKLQGKKSEEKHAAEYLNINGVTMFYSPYFVSLLKERIKKEKK